MKKISAALSIIISLLLYNPCYSQVHISPVDAGGLDNEVEATKGWGAGSVENDNFEIKTSKTIFPGDTTVSYIKSKKKNESAYGAVYHCISLKEFKGQRVRMTGWAKTSNVVDTNEAGFWFFANSDTMSVLDNAIINGATDWTKYSLIIDVFPHSYMFTCGVFLRGTGEIQFKNINFEVVDTSIQVTAQGRKKK